MSLPVISYAGIRVYSSDLITDEENSIYLLGIAGYQTAVKGIIANVLEGESVYMIRNSQYEYYQRTEESFSTNYLKLPSGLYQGMVISVIGLPEHKQSDKGFLVIGEDMASIKKLFFRHLDEKSGVPLHSDWTEWLWNTFIEKEWLRELQTVIGNLKGFIVTINEQELQDSVTEAIAYQIPEIIGCFEKGDTDVSKQSERVSG